MKYEVIAPNDRAYIWSIYRDDDAFVASFNAVFPESEARAKNLCDELNGKFKDENKRKPFMERELSNTSVVLLLLLTFSLMVFLQGIFNGR